jgi:hypothetical protein
VEDELMREAVEDDVEEVKGGMEELEEEERVEGAGGEGIEGEGAGEGEGLEEIEWGGSERGVGTRLGGGGRGTAAARPCCPREGGAVDQPPLSSSDVEVDIEGGSPESDSKSPGSYLSSQWVTDVERLSRP